MEKRNISGRNGCRGSCCSCRLFPHAAPAHAGENVKGPVDEQYQQMEIVLNDLEATRCSPSRTLTRCFRLRTR